jgi:hypothetical protein
MAACTVTRDVYLAFSTLVDADSRSNTYVFWAAGDVLDNIPQGICSLSKL